MLAHQYHANTCTHAKTLGVQTDETPMPVTPPISEKMVCPAKGFGEKLADAANNPEHDEELTLMALQEELALLEELEELEAAKAQLEIEEKGLKADQGTFHVEQPKCPLVSHWAKKDQPTVCKNSECC